MKIRKIHPLLIAAGIVSATSLFAQTSITPADTSNILNNRNSTPADLDKNNANTSDNATRDKSARKAAVDKTIIGRLGAGDKNFVAEARTSDATEIETGKLALSNSSNAKIKDFANQMIADHTKLSASLNSVLAKQNVDVESAKPDAAEIAKLKPLQGAEFDKAYIQDVAVDGHRKAVDLFTQESKEGDNPALKAAAKEALPTIKHHYKMAEKLAKSTATTSSDKAPH